MGYVAGNVAALDPMINRMKGTRKSQEFLTHLKKMVAHLLPGVDVATMWPNISD